MTGVTAVTRELSLPLDSETEARIARFIASLDSHHYRQTPAWLQADKTRRYRVFVTEEATAITALSFAAEAGSRLPGLGRIDVVRGPLFSSPAALNAHLDGMRSLLGRHYAELRINPFLPPGSVLLDADAGWQPSSSQNDYDATVLVAVLESEEAQWRSLRRSTRTAINKSRKLNYRIEQADSELQYRDFARQFNTFAAERGIGDLDEDTSAGLYQHFAAAKPTQAALLTAYTDNTALGAMLLLRNDDSWVYEWGWTNQAVAAQHLPVMHRLVWEAIELARREDCRFVDLGGYWTDRGASDPINHFKLGFSKTIRHYTASHSLVLSPVRHRIAKLIQTLRGG